MKSLLLTTLLVAATMLPGGCAEGGQNTEPRSSQIAASTASTSQNEEQVLLDVEREWGDAMTNHDMAALGRILGDDHSVITKDGSVLTKAQEMANYKSNESSNELSDFEPMKVRIYGETAVVTGGHREKSHNFGKDTSGHYRWTDLFVKRDGRWQAVSSELTRVEEERSIKQ